MQHTIESYNKWEKHFKNGPGQHALKILKNKFSGDENYNLLESFVLENCYFACHYEKESDVNIINRRNCGPIFDKKLKSAITDLEEVISFAKNYPFIFEWDLLIETLTKSNKTLMVKDEPPYSHTKALIEFLEKCIKIMKKTNPIIYYERSMNYIQIGALVFPHIGKSLKRFNRFDSLVSSLSYKLIDNFQNHTARWKGVWYEMPRPLLPHGTPCLGFVVEFVNAVLLYRDNNSQKDIDENNLKSKKFFLDSQKVRIGHWFPESASLEIFRAAVNNKKSVFLALEDS